MRTRVVRIQRPTTLLGWLGVAVVVAVGLALVVLFTTVGLILLAAAMILGPVVAWWRGRRSGGRAAPRPRTDAGGHRVIDVEYEVHDKRP